MAKVSLVTFYDTTAIGMRCIASYLEHYNHEVQLIFVKRLIQRQITSSAQSPEQYQIVRNGTLYGHGLDVDKVSSIEWGLLDATLQDYTPDVIGISTRSFFDEYAIDFAKRIKKQIPKALLIAGGFGPTLSPVKYLDAYDIVVLGEGEESCLEIANRVDSGDKLTGIENTAYRDEGGYQQNRLSAPAIDLSKYPHPMFFGDNCTFVQNNSVYDADPATFEENYSILAGRGCVGKCTYCSGGNWRKIYKDNGRNMPPRRNRPVHQIMDELQRAKRRGAKRVSFKDEFLVGSYDFLMELFTRYRDEINLPFFAYVHPSIPEKHQDILDVMLEGGLDCTSIGIQTGAEKFAQSVYKRFQKNAHIVSFAKHMAKYDVQINYHFIGANPLESNEHFEETLELVSRLPFDPVISTIYWFYFTIFPGAPISEHISDDKMSKRDSEDWHKKGQILYLKFLNPAGSYPIEKYSVDELKNEILAAKMKLILQGKYSVLSSGKEQEYVYAEIAKQFVGRDVYAWGYGEAFRQRHHLLDGCTIKRVIDSNPKLHGTLTPEGVPVVSPEELYDLKKAPIFIFSSYKRDIVKQLQKMSLGDCIVP